MKVENISPSALIPYEGNPRIHSDNQIQKLQESIREYGIVLPVLIDAENVILSGHAVVRACQNLEIAEIPCIRDTNLTEAQKHAYILADNRLAGSGTTIIAAESCRRICYAVELNPEYVDMAVKRWQDYTGRKAILENDGRSFDEVSALRGEIVE